MYAPNIEVKTPLCFSDTETTSLAPDRKVWEVALIRRDVDGSPDRITQFFVDVDLRGADPFALRVGKYWDRHPAGIAASQGKVNGCRPFGVLSLEDAAVAIFAATRGAHLIGMNPGFDAGGFEGMLRRVGLLPEWNHHLVDLGGWICGYLARAGRAVTLPYSSDVVAAQIGVPFVQPGLRHTAIGDSLWCRDIWDAISGRPLTLWPSVTGAGTLE